MACTVTTHINNVFKEGMGILSLFTTIRLLFNYNKGKQMSTRTPIGHSRRGSFVIDPVFLHMNITEPTGDVPVFVRSTVKLNNDIDKVWSFNPSNPELLFGLQIYQTRKMLTKMNLMDQEIQFDPTVKKKVSIFKLSSYSSLWSERSKSFSSFVSTSDEEDNQKRASKSKWLPFRKLKVNNNKDSKEDNSTDELEFRSST